MNPYPCRFLTEPGNGTPGVPRKPRTEQSDGKLHFEPVQVFHMGISHLPERFQRLVRPLARTAIQQNHGVFIRKKLRSPLFHLICRNIQGSLLMSRAVLIRSSDIHQHNRGAPCRFPETPPWRREQGRVPHSCLSARRRGLSARSP